MAPDYGSVASPPGREPSASARSRRALVLCAWGALMLAVVGTGCLLSGSGAAGTREGLRAVNLAENAGEPKHTAQEPNDRSRDTLYVGSDRNYAQGIEKQDSKDDEDEAVARDPKKEMDAIMDDDEIAKKDRANEHGTTAGAGGASGAGGTNAAQGNLQAQVDALRSTVRKNTHEIVEEHAEIAKLETEVHVLEEHDELEHATAAHPASSHPPPPPPPTPTHPHPPPTHPHPPPTHSHSHPPPPTHTHPHPPPTHSHPHPPPPPPHTHSHPPPTAHPTVYPTERAATHTHPPTEHHVYHAFTEEGLCGEVDLRDHKGPCTVKLIVDATNMIQGTCASKGYGKKGETVSEEAGKCGTIKTTMYACSGKCADCDWFHSLTESGECADACLWDKGKCNRARMVDTLNLKPGQCETIRFTKLDKGVDVNAGVCGVLPFMVYKCGDGQVCPKCTRFYRVTEHGKGCEDVCLWNHASCPRSHVLGEFSMLKRGECENLGYTVIDGSNDLKMPKDKCSDTLEFEVYAKPKPKPSH